MLFVYTLQINILVSIYFNNKQLLLFSFAHGRTHHLFLWPSFWLLRIIDCLRSMALWGVTTIHHGRQGCGLSARLYCWGQKAATAYLKSKQLLLFVFELQDSLLPSSTGMLTAVQRQTAVTADLNVSSYCWLAFHGNVEINMLCHFYFTW